MTNDSLKTELLGAGSISIQYGSRTKTMAINMVREWSKNGKIRLYIRDLIPNT